MGTAGNVGLRVEGGLLVTPLADWQKRDEFWKIDKRKGTRKQLFDLTTVPIALLDLTADLKKPKLAGNLIHEARYPASIGKLGCMLGAHQLLRGRPGAREPRLEPGQRGRGRRILVAETLGELHGEGRGQRQTDGEAAEHAQTRSDIRARQRNLVSGASSQMPVSESCATHNTVGTNATALSLTF